MKRLLIIVCCIILSLTGCARNNKIGNTQTKKTCNYFEASLASNFSTAVSSLDIDNSKKEILMVENVQATAISRNQIKLTWSMNDSSNVEKYIIMRRNVNSIEWQRIGEAASNHSISLETYTYEDALISNEPTQFEYRIELQLLDKEKYIAKDSKTILTSNIILCVDPGHFAGRNTVIADGGEYCEGEFVLELGKELKKILEEQYGVTVRLTRNLGTITVDGYTDAELDTEHISLRGQKAEGCNMFISLHTNANKENANGYGTDSQPIDINKPFVIVNTIGMQDETTMKIANPVGKNLAQTSYELGIAKADKFEQIDGEAREWSNEWNDSLKQKGAICKRTKNGEDYYGVLRGASNVNVPGLIIEHGFHTVPEMRKVALEGKLQVEWAKADAQGIVEGFELVTSNNLYLNH